jgi:multidrug efflux pump
VLLRWLGGKTLHSAAPHDAPECAPHIDTNAPPTTQPHA